MQSSHSQLTRLSRLEVLLIAMALVAGPFLVTPVVLHSTNVLNFSVGLVRALSGSLLLATTLLVTIYLVLRQTSRWPWFNARIAALMLALGYLFWIQGHLLVWDYGVLDGRAIDWQDQWLRGLLEAALWITLLIGAWFGAARLRPQLGLLAGVLLAIYVVTMTSSIIGRDATPAFHRYALDETHKYDYSSDQNVVLIVADAFQSDVFQELIDTRPELFNGFDGFTFYRNATAGFAKTYPSIPLMLTGQWYANAEPISTFVENAFLDHSVTADLIQSGWRVDLFPVIPRVIHHDDRVASNVVEKGNPADIASESGRLTDLSLFRVSPHFLKRYWLNDNQYRLSPAWKSWVQDRSSDTPLRQAVHDNAAARFALSAEQFGRVRWDQPAFKFYHLMVPHEPFLLREDFSVKRWPAGREGFTGQSAATVRVLEKFVESLKALGIYDNTTIVVVADHGGGDYNAGVRAAKVVTDAAPDFMPDMSPQQHASALPLVFIKPENTGGVLRISDTPVSIGNVAATLARAAGTAAKAGGAIGDLEADSNGTRHYYFYRHSGWSGEFLPPMEEFEVKQHSWDIADWSATGRIIAPGGEIQNVVGYEPGNRVRFNGGGQASTWLRNGWSGAEASGTWSSSDTATLHIPLAHSGSAAAITHAHFWLAPFLAEGQLKAQSATLSLNGTPLQQWQVQRPGCYSAPLPEALVQGNNALVFSWSLPDAAAPKDFGLSDDFRTLAILLQAMQLGSGETCPKGP